MPIDKTYLEEQERKVKPIDERKPKVKEPVLVVNLSESSLSKENDYQHEQGLLEKARHSLMTAHLNEERGHSESEYLTKRSYSQNTTQFEPDYD